VPHGIIDYVLNKDWKYNDEQVLTVFYEIVNAHWEEHLKELGVKFVRYDDVSTFEGLHPEQRPAHTTKWQQWRARSQQLTSQAKQGSPTV